MFGLNLDFFFVSNSEIPLENPHSSFGFPFSSVQRRISPISFLPCLLLPCVISTVRPRLFFAFITVSSVLVSPPHRTKASPSHLATSPSAFATPLMDHASTARLTLSPRRTIATTFPFRPCTTAVVTLFLSHLGPNKTQKWVDQTTAVLAAPPSAAARRQLPPP